MTTQLLFGDVYEVVETLPKWLKIKTFYDDYFCWIDKKQHQSIAESEYKQLANKKHFAVAADVASVIEVNHQLQTILLGSSLPYQSPNAEFKINNNLYRFDGPYFAFDSLPNKSKLTENALLLLNTPYLWGGRTPFGIDCSGLTQLVYKLNGIVLPRDAYQQAEKGITLSFVEEAEPGDLAFFDNDEGHIVHVGIMLENNKIIHASGKVRIDNIDHHGIYNSETKTYTHQLRLIKKLI